MIRLIKFLFTGDWHLHEWKEYGKTGITCGGRTTSHIIIRECKHCGKLQEFRLNT
jgi:hypothetical protein